MTDAFADRAAAWDDNPVRVAVAQAFFTAAHPLAGSAASGAVLDFGCGTGLLGLLFAAAARRVDLVDTSPAMVQVLRGKLAAQGLAGVAVHLGDLADLKLPEASFDLVVSLNALHHIPDIPKALAQGASGVLCDRIVDTPSQVPFALLMHPREAMAQISRLCVPGGQVLVADLMAEDGSFHGPETAPHNGFDPAALALLFTASGLRVQNTLQHHTIVKPDATGALRRYPQFLLHARKA